METNGHTARPTAEILGSYHFLAKIDDGIVSKADSLPEQGFELVKEPNSIFRMLNVHPGK